MGKKRVWYIPMIIILFIFLLLTVALVGRNIALNQNSSDQKLEMLMKEDFQKENEQDDAVKQGEQCLYLWDSRDENSRLFHDQMPQILQDMRVDYTESDAASGETVTFEKYETVVLGYTDYQTNSEQLLALADWTEAGGQLLIAQVPTAGSMYSWMSRKMGVTSTGVTYYEVSEIQVTDDLLLTGEEKVYSVPHPFASSIAVTLLDTCEVHMITADERKIPLVWETSMGQGHAVVVNLGHYEKEYRGIYAAAYSLLGDYCLWPVINSSAFYLDGVPFPLPSGENEYITAQYGENMDIYTFYVREWMNDLMAFSRKYDIPLTGTLQENNDGDVDPPYRSTASSNRYEYFISLLLETGGEVGLYGYNQQPLCVPGDNLKPANPEGYEGDYERDLGLMYWETAQNMEKSLQEVIRFQKEIDQEQEMQVYTPPYGIISQSGISALKSAAPKILAVAGWYSDSGYATGQEFGIDEDGMIYTPRITSGSYVGDTQRLAALSELTMHYVSTHAISPQDVVNPDAGAGEGWDAMMETLEGYENWLESAAPGLRRHSGSETAAAIQRYAYLEIRRFAVQQGLELTLENFQDEAWIMLRFNQWEPDLEKGVEGGSLEQLSGNLYLLKAEQEKITIHRKAES